MSGIGEQRVVAAVCALDARARRRSARRSRARGWQRRGSRASADCRAPARNWRLIRAVEMMPHLTSTARHTTRCLPVKHRVRARARQPDRRAHRLQRGPGAAVRDQRGRDRARRADRRRRMEAIARRPRRARRVRARRSRRRLRGWRAFVRGRGRGAAARRRVACAGARLQICGDVPRGAGLSSSAALEVALTLALIALADAPEPDRIELAKLCSRIENEWVGAQTGLLDQLASLLGEEDRALRIDFRSLEITPVPLELGEFRLVTLRLRATSTRTPPRATTSAARECALAARSSACRACATRRSRRPRRCRRRSTGAPRTSSPRTACRRGGGALERRRHGRARPAARRLARQPARLLRGVHARGREGGRQAARGGRAGSADHRRRLRRPRARADAA